MLNGTTWWEVRARYVRAGQRRVRLIVRSYPRDWIGRHVERAVRAELLAEGLELLGVHARGSHHDVASCGFATAWTPAPARHPPRVLERPEELVALLEDDPEPHDAPVERPLYPLPEDAAEARSRTARQRQRDERGRLLPSAAHP